MLILDENFILAKAINSIKFPCEMNLRVKVKGGTLLQISLQPGLSSWYLNVLSRTRNECCQNKVHILH